MNISSIILRRITGKACQAATEWGQFWFRPTEPCKLAVLRIFTGVCMLCLYAGCIPEVLSYIGPDAWIDQSTHGQMVSQSETQARLPWHAWSVWNNIKNPTLVLVMLGVFLGSIVCFTIGLFSRTANALAWIGHLSFCHRGMIVTYGVDYILAMLLLYQLIGPSGARLSIDALWSSRQKCKDYGRAEPRTYWNANLAIRLIQVHICIVYLCAGLAKLQGEDWWSGYAIWQVLITPELSAFDMRWLAGLGDVALQLICGFGAAMTLGFEISFAFLIWNPRLRPVLIFLSVVLHGAIGVLMGLYAFSFVMLTGCLAFVDPEKLKLYVQDLLEDDKRQRGRALLLHGKTSLVHR